MRTGLNLSSRVVENLYWFGRDTERCDDMARLLRVALMRVIEEGPAERDELLARHRGHAARTPASSARRSRPPTKSPIARALRAAVTDDARPGLAGGLKELLRVASQLRERLSLDNWRTLNQMARRLAARAAAARSRSRRRSPNSTATSPPS